MESAGPYHLSIEKRCRTKSMLLLQKEGIEAALRSIVLSKRSKFKKLRLSLELNKNSTPITKALDTIDIKIPKLMPVIITIQIIFKEKMILIFFVFNLTADIISVTNT